MSKNKKNNKSKTKINKTGKAYKLTSQVSGAPCEILAASYGAELSQVLSGQDKYTSKYISKICKNKDKIQSLSKKITGVFKEILSNCKDVPDIMNVWSEKSNNTVIDTLNFSECISKEDRYNVMNEDAIRGLQVIGDISALWSVSDTVDIILSDKMFMRVNRVNFDENDRTIEYCVYAYRKIKISDDNLIVVPIDCMSIKLGLIGKKLEFDEKVNSEDMDKQIGNRIGLRVRYNKNMTPVCEYVNGLKVIARINGDFNLGNMLTHLINNHKHLSKDEYKTIRECLTNITYDVCGTNAEEYIFNELNKICALSSSFVTSAIIIANKFIHKKEVSKTTNAEVKHIVGDEILKRPERKKCLLGDSIVFESSTIPKAMGIDKIIKYHIPEWDRKEHLRHLKSGKVIKVKASQCKRRCVNITSRHKLEKQGIDYVVKSKKE